MSDEPFYSPNWTAMPPRQPKPRECLWSLWQIGRRIDCELRFHGESYRWDCQLLEERSLLYGQRFVRHEHALEEAEAQRRRLISEGWIAA